MSTEQARRQHCRCTGTQTEKGGDRREGRKRKKPKFHPPAPALRDEGFNGGFPMPILGYVPTARAAEFQLRGVPS